MLRIHRATVACRCQCTGLGTRRTGFKFLLGHETYRVTLGQSSSLRLTYFTELLGRERGHLYHSELLGERVGQNAINKYIALQSFEYSLTALKKQQKSPIHLSIDFRTPKFKILHLYPALC